MLTILPLTFFSAALFCSSHPPPSPPSPPQRRYLLSRFTSTVLSISQALAAVNSRKKVFSILRGSFSQDGITDFVRELVGKAGVIIPLKKESLPTIETIEPWDGQDGQVGIDWDNRIH